jgi:hypothetical protein
VDGLREPVILRGRARKLFDDVAIWAARHGRQVTVVSANDHEHSRGSAHYRDAAIDVHADDHELDALDGWLRSQGYVTFWRVAGHYGHLHAEDATQVGASP